MFLDNKIFSFRAHCHIIKHDSTSQLNTNRRYPQNYRMVWLAIGVIALILLLDAVGLLSKPLYDAQQAILQGKTESYVEIVGTVTESKKGQTYCFMQLETGEQLYLKFPYAHDIWYPAGTQLAVKGVVSLPEGQRNPGGFDQAAWLKSRKIGLVLQADTISIVREATGIWRIIRTLYTQLESVLYQSLTEEQANLAMALLTGAKHRLSDDFYRMTQQMGIAHIFAVSGLHVGIIGSVIIAIFQHCGLMHSWFAFVLFAMSLTMYCMLVGLPASAIRASTMLLLSALAIRLHRPSNSINFLAFAAVLLLIDNPFLLWNAGFQLSFGVTLSLLLFTVPIEKRLEEKLPWLTNRYLRSSISVVAAAWIGSIPFSAWHFYTVTPLSPFYNFVLVPLVSAAVPFLLSATFLSVVFPVGAQIFFLPAKFVLILLQEGTVLMYAMLHRVQWNVGQPTIWTIFFYVALVVLLWYALCVSKPKELHGLQSIIIFLVIVILLQSIPHAPKEHQLLYLDTGQGSCALLRTKQGEVVLFDAGAQTQELASVLAWYGINEIDAVILSHGDTDHITGLQQVLERVSVKQLFLEQSQVQRETMLPLLQFAEKQKVTCHVVSYTEHILLQDFLIRLKVVQDSSQSSNKEGNQVQLTAMLQHENNTVAFPGDLSLHGIERMVAAEHQITIWTVPHHGSRYSGSEKLYQRLKQKGVAYAVISAGKENRYGHPHQEVLQWLTDANISYSVTAEQGAILFYLK